MEKVNCSTCNHEPLLKETPPSTANFNHGAVNFGVVCTNKSCVASNCNIWDVTPDEAWESWYAKNLCHETVIDMTGYEEELFCGPKNGTKWRDKLLGVYAQRYLFKLRHDQLVTASFIRGLLKDRVVDTPLKIGCTTVGRQKSKVIQLTENKRAARSLAMEIGKKECRRIMAN